MKKNKAMIVTFLAPALFMFIMVFLYPICRTVVMSFFKIEGITDSFSKWQFTGIDNYVKLMNTTLFKTSMWNLFRIWFIGGIIVMSLALLFAVILTSGIRFKSFFRAMIYLPNVVSAVALATMWLQYVYNNQYGLLSGVFKKLGLTSLAKIQWLDSDHKFYALLFAYCFGMVGYHMLIFMSGIERISADYYEAASIEGANVFKKFWYITFPLLRGSIRTNLVMWTVSSVGFFIWGQVFDPVNLSEQTVMPLNYMYELVFGASNAVQAARDSGVGAAIGVMMAVIVVAVFSLTTLIIKNDDAEL